MASRRILFAVVIACLLSALTSAQPMPQTARQALIEMLFSKTPGTFDKHLPETTLAAMRKAPPGSPAAMVETFALLSTQMQTQNHGGRFETFEAGPTLLVAEDPTQNSKIEVVVDHDDLRGSEDEIELSFNVWKNGESQTGGVVPHLIFNMQQEKSVWKLYGATFSIGISLTDPKLLKALSTPIQPKVTATMTTAGGDSTMQSPTPFGMNVNNESSVIAAMRTINTAQVTYAATYPNQGFACSLSFLGGMGGGSTPDERHAMLVEPRLANGRKSGYVLRVSNCNGSPATAYSLTAVPADSSSGTKAYCTDQTAVIRFSPDGNGANCLSSGKPVN
jgi:type IV pilus assembly protein PilA